MGRSCGSDPELLWLWCRLAATALIRPLAWEPPYAAGVALEKAKREKKKKRICRSQDKIGKTLQGCPVGKKSEQKHIHLPQREDRQ